MKRALKLHPDRQKGKVDTDAFTTMKHAYDILSDPVQKAQYDDKLRAAKEVNGQFPHNKSNQNAGRSPFGDDHSASTQTHSNQQQPGPEPGSQPGHSNDVSDSHRRHSSSGQQNPFGDDPSSRSRGQEKTRSEQPEAYSSKYPRGGQQQTSSRHQSPRKAGPSKKPINSRASQKTRSNQQQPGPEPGPQRGHSNDESDSHRRHSSSGRQNPFGDDPSSRSRGQEKTRSEQPEADSSKCPRGGQQQTSSRHQSPRKTGPSKKPSNSRGAHSSSDAGEKSQHNYSDRPKVFGFRQDGQPCQRCIHHGRYCYQHADQDPQSSHYGCKSTGRPRQERAAGGRTFGVCKDGEVCKRCLKQDGFCFQHKPQQKGPQGSRSGSQTFGVSKNGLPCKRCIQQGRHCHQR